MNFILKLSEFLSDKKLKAGVWFFLLNSAFVFFISIKYLSLLFSPVSSGASEIHPFYSAFACYSHFIAIAFLPFVLLFLPLCLFKVQYKGIKCVVIVVSTLALIVLAIDAYVFSLYRFHLNSYVLEQVFGPASGQVFEFSIGQYIAVASILFGLLAIEWGVFRIAEKLAQRNWFRIPLAVLVLWSFALVGVQLYRTYALFKGDRSILAIENYFPMVVPFYPNQFFPQYDFSIPMEVEGKSYIYPKRELATHPTRKNLLIISFDSWRASTLDSLTAPNICRFSKRAHVFTRHYSGSNGTKSGVFTLFYGLPGAYFRDFQRQSLSPVLLDVLKQNGNDMHLFPSASLRNPPLDKTVFLTLADQCDPTEGLNAWQRDENLSTKFRHYLAERDTTVPFFSFLFFDSLHSMIKPDDFKGPFQPSWNIAHYERLGKDVDPGEFLNLYKNMVYYLDSLVGEILNDLESRGELDNTIVVITGDHAQEFDDSKHAFWGHNGNFSEAQLHVPFVYYDGKEASVHDAWTSHYDVVPTLMKDLFRVENPTEDYCIGKDLFEVEARDYLLVDSYIGVGVLDSNGKGTNLLYDGTLQIVDEKLTEDYGSSVDEAVVSFVMSTLSQFYEKGR